MNAPFSVAQVVSAPNSAAAPKIVKVTKPADGQAITVQMDGSVKLDLTAIASEKITLVRVGERLTILFENKSTVTIDPFFDSSGRPLQISGIELETNRIVTGEEFATLFPITDNQSVLPAAGEQAAAAQNTGSAFGDPSVDPLGSTNPLDLLGQEELGTWDSAVDTALVDTPTSIIDLVPSQIAGIFIRGVVEEEHNGGGMPARMALSEGNGGPRGVGSGLGNEDPNDAADGPGLDQDDGEDFDNTTLTVTGEGANSLAALFSGGDGALHFSIKDVTAVAPSEESPNLPYVKDVDGNTVYSNGQPVVFSHFNDGPNADTIEGWAGDRLVFTLVVQDNGDWTFTLHDTVDHLDPTHDNGTTDTGALEEALGIDFSELIQGVDSNGTPFAIQGTGIFVVDVLDDTPELYAYEDEMPTLTVDETNLSIDASASFAWNFDARFGADGQGAATTYALGINAGSSGLVDVATGQPVVLSLNNGVVEGRAGGELVFTLSVDANGTVTLNQLRALEHSPDSGPDQAATLSAANLVTLTSTISDFDGDTHSAVLNIGQNLVFHDDAPTAGYAGRTTLTEDTQANGTFIVQTATGTMTFQGGADGAKITSLNYDIAEGGGAGIADGDADDWTTYPLTSNGQAITVSQQAGANGPMLIGKLADGTVIFEIEVTNASTGAYKVTLNGPLDHPDKNEVGGEDPLRMRVSFTVTDGDGDTTTGHVQIDINDDGPTIGASQTRTVDEDGLDGGNVEPAGENGDVPHAATSRTGSLAISWGADSHNPSVDNGAAVASDRSVSFANIVGGAAVLKANGQPLTSDGEAVVFRVGSNNEIYGVVPGSNGGEDREVFRVELSDVGDGSYTFELLDNVDHPDNGQNNENNIRLEFDFTATDSDGDSADGSFTVRINDDTPVQNSNQEIGRVDEDDLRNYAPLAHALGWPIQGSNGTSPDGDTAWHGGTATEGSLANLVNFGADGAAADGGFSFVFDNNNDATAAIAALGLNSKGDAVDTARLLGDWLIAGTDDRIVFALKLESDGSYRFVLFDQLDHPRGDRPNTEALEAIEDRINIDFSSFIEATDGDGDAIILDDGSFIIRVRDDIPEVVGQEHHSVSENDLANFNPAYPILFNFWQGSLGTSPYDGPSDGITGLLGTVPVWGTLADNIKGGADERGEFHLVSESRAEDLLATLGPDGDYLTSKGQDINDARFVHIDGIGEVMGFFSADGRLVFGLYLNENGLYNFRLFDQLDHPLGDNPNTDAPESAEDSLSIDFSEFVTYSDYDGDTIDLGEGVFVIDVKDDVPVVVGTEHHTINENDLANFNPLYPLVFDFWQGSLGTSPDFNFADDSVTGLLGTVPVWGALTDNIRGGADEFGHFNVVTEARAELLLATAGGTEANPGYLTSKGQAINDARMITIDGIGDVMGFFAADGRLVFGLFVTDVGIYNFRLFDQLDHPLTDDPTTEEIETAFADTIEIDLSQFVTYTDADGDTIDLGEGVFVIGVTDDIPMVIGSVSVTLDESDLSNYNPLWTSVWSLVPWTSIQGPTAAARTAIPIRWSARPHSRASSTRSSAATTLWRVARTSPASSASCLKAGPSNFLPV